MLHLKRKAEKEPCVQRAFFFSRILFGCGKKNKILKKRLYFFVAFLFKVFEQLRVGGFLYILFCFFFSFHFACVNVIIIICVALNGISNLFAVCLFLCNLKKNRFFIFFQEKLSVKIKFLSVSSQRSQGHICHFVILLSRKRVFFNFDQLLVLFFFDHRVLILFHI